MKKLNLLRDNKDLAAEWNYEKNNKINICCVNSSEKVWWKCSKGIDHEWEAMICNRIKKRIGCPCCSNHKAVRSNCLKTTHPIIAKEWHPKNDLTASDVTAGSNRRVWWKCVKDESHCWETEVNQRIRSNTRCPYCSGFKATKENNVTTEFPELLKEWDYSKNEIKPESLLSGNKIKVWWKCSKDDSHSWQATVGNRSNNNTGCPYCCGKKVDNKTSFANCFPELLKEWDYSKNEIKPTELLPNSHKKVWWICQKDETHIWKSNLNNRIASNSGCPYCNESRGEKLIVKYLNEIKLTYSRQYKFSDCCHKRRLPFDFAIHVKDKLGLIEFHGKQHYEPIDHFGGEVNFEKQIFLDKIKSEYCSKKGIPFLEIKYNQTQMIPSLIESFVLTLTVK